LGIASFIFLTEERGPRRRGVSPSREGRKEEAALVELFGILWREFGRQDPSHRIRINFLSRGAHCGSNWRGRC
jgi:hypothetical protein